MRKMSKEQAVRFHELAGEIGRLGKESIALMDPARGMDALVASKAEYFRMCDRIKALDEELTNLMDSVKDDGS